jgi:hypothetical protein
MIKMLVELRDIGTGVGFPIQDKTPIRHHHRFVIYKSEPCRPWMKREVANGRAFCVGSFRDARDVAASLFRFYGARAHHRNENIEYTDIWNDVIAEHLPNAILWHSDWEKLGIYQTRYEIVHPSEWHIFLVGVGRHIGIDVTMEEAKVIRRQFTIAKNAARCELIAERGHWISPQTLLTAGHIGENRGRVNTFAEHLSKDQIKQVIDVAGEWMNGHGYPTE